MHRERADIVPHSVKVLPLMLASYIRLPDVLLPIQLSGKVGKGGPSVWTPDVHMEDLDAVLGS